MSYIRKYLTMVTSAMLTLCLLLLFQDLIVPAQLHNEISLEAVGSNGEIPRGEIWLTNVTIDGVTISLEQLEVTNQQNWEYEKTYDDYVYYPGYLDNEFVFIVRGESVTLDFVSSVWSGMVEITDIYGYQSAIDLQTNENDLSVYTIQIKPERSLRKVFVPNLICGVLIFIAMKNIIDGFGSKGIYRGDLSLKQGADSVKYGIWWVLCGVILIRWLYAENFVPYVIYDDSTGYIDYPWESFLHLDIISGRCPGYPLFISIIRWIFKENYLCAIAHIQGILSIISLYFLYKTILLVTENNYIAMIMVFAYGINPDIVVWDYSILTESLAITSTVIYIYILILFIKKPKMNVGILTVIYSVMIVFLRPTFLLFFAILCGFWCLRGIFEPNDRRLLKKIAAVTSCGILLIVGYSLLFNENFGYFSLSDAMPRQNVVSSILRGYYIECEDTKFVSIIDEALRKQGNDVWDAWYSIKEEFGESKANNLAKDTLYGQPLRYCIDTFEMMIDDSQHTFAEYYVSRAKDYNNKENFIFKILEAIQRTFCVEIVFVYLCWMAESCTLLLYLFKKKRKEIPWIHLGLWIFLTLIPISTYMATCGEFSRTMIHILPYIYISGSICINALCEISKNKYE